MIVDQRRLLNQMCQRDLSDADIRAISKARGFSAQEAASRASFENFMLSDIGAAEALRSLTQKEIILLHLLKLKKAPVDVSFFKHYYDLKPEGHWEYGTFTYRHQKTFKAVKKNLLRKGILLMTEDKGDINAKAKMERWRFWFPTEFHALLPAPFPKSKMLDAPGGLNELLVRNKLLEITGHQSSAIRLRGQQYNLNLKDGRLRFGDKLFQVDLLQAWQKAEWAFDLEKHRPAQKEQAGPKRVHSKYLLGPLEATTYALSQLKPKEWIKPDDLSPWLRIFCRQNDMKDAAKICSLGWRWGCLLKQTVNGQSYYRLPDNNLPGGTSPNLTPDRCLHLDSRQTVTVNLQTIPWQSLEYLNRIANLKASGAQLTAAPNFIQMGRFLKTRAQPHPLTLWLQKNSPAFKKAIETLDARWGKQIVHQNLLIAKINDVGLKIMLQKTISNPEQIIFLPNDFIAFPQEMLKAVEKQVNKSGHIIKTVNP